MKKKINLNLFAFCLLCLLACKKDEVTTDAVLEDGKSIVIKDLAGDTETSLGNNIPGKEQRPFFTFLFRVKDQKQIWIKSKADSAQYLKSTDWDIAFTGNYNSIVFVNNGTAIGSPGFGGDGISKVVKVDQAYNNITEAPADNDFQNSDVNEIGWAESSTSAGWYTYDLNTHIMKRIVNRTYILKLNSGKYAKLEIVSIYKGNPPAVTDLYWPSPYLTFRYFVQEDGSKNLKTK
ncbi:MAG: hypothetical protein EOO42_01415 [Flavobacteriales bacterium]|nr:MAG: hypothetical protein EOO42_01415 [Flavobacteriales bacterium]